MDQRHRGLAVKPRDDRGQVGVQGTFSALFRCINTCEKMGGGAGWDGHKSHTM